MAKSFDTNVAMNWVSADIMQANQPVETKQPVQEKKTNNVIEDNGKETVTNSSEEKSVGKKTVTKKETTAPTAKKSKEDHQPFTIVGKELKTRQTSLLLKESTYSKLEALSKKNGISVNSCINQILEQVLS